MKDRTGRYHNFNQFHFWCQKIKKNTDIFASVSRETDKKKVYLKLFTVSKRPFLEEYFDITHGSSTKKWKDCHLNPVEVILSHLPSWDIFMVSKWPLKFATFDKNEKIAQGGGHMPMGQNGLRSSWSWSWGRFWLAFSISGSGRPVNQSKNDGNYRRRGLVGNYLPTYKKFFPREFTPGKPLFQGISYMGSFFPSKYLSVVFSILRW